MKTTIDKLPKLPARYANNAVTYITKDGVEVTVIPSVKTPRLSRVAVYCRVSTAHPEQQESLEAQLSYYEDYVHRHKAWLFVGAYTDTKSARSIHARDQFEKMIAHCMEGRIDTIITKTVSRFGRNTVDTLMILRNLKERGIDVFFENEGLHSFDGKDELLISLIEAIAQAESENRSQNIKWGIKQHAQNPDAAIYSRPCYGYRKADDGELEIYEEEAKIVRQIFDLYLSGYSVLKIKRELESRSILTPAGKAVWAKRTIETILGNEKYTGDVLVYKTYCPEYPQTARIRNKGEKEKYCVSHHHMPIIEKSVFERVQSERKHRSNIVMDEEGIAHRRESHYSMKAALSGKGNEPVQAQNCTIAE
ncbi:MAG: recombinase family protein [Oscillospiraceae bacterium]|jgi:DNA invertase Pin-like site-specific DNA recombinase|nr:recombinase family protein [Oscillospiraceae bacterium]